MEWISLSLPMEWIAPPVEWIALAMRLWQPKPCSEHFCSQKV